jgi:hypothetical protein
MHCVRVCKRCRIPVRDSDVSQRCTVSVRDAEYLSEILMLKSLLNSVCWSYGASFRGARCHFEVQSVRRRSECLVQMQHGCQRCRSPPVRCRASVEGAECLKEMQSFH